MTKKFEEEIAQAYTINTVMEEAQRCLLCLDAPCSKSCPAGTDPAKFIRSVRFRNFKGALKPFVRTMLWVPSAQGYVLQRSIVSRAAHGVALIAQSISEVFRNL